MNAAARACPPAKNGQTSPLAPAIQSKNWSVKFFWGGITSCFKKDPLRLCYRRGETGFCLRAGLPLGPVNVNWVIPPPPTRPLPTHPSRSLRVAHAVCIGLGIVMYASPGSFPSPGLACPSNLGHCGPIASRPAPRARSFFFGGDNIIYFKSVLRWKPAFAFGFATRTRVLRYHYLGVLVL